MTMRLSLILSLLAVTVAALPAPDADADVDADTHTLAKRDKWPNEQGQQLYTFSGSSSCLIVGHVSASTPVYVEECTGSNFPGWVLPPPGSAGQIRLANTRLCLDAGQKPTADRPLVVKPCQTTGPCDPTIGNAQRWWGPQGSAATDYWIENAGHYRVQAVHTKFCLEARDGRAYVSCCSPNHDHVNLVSQLWSPNMHG